MNIAAFDLATQTGWATLTNGEIVSGSNSFKLKPGEPEPLRNWTARRFFHRLIIGKDLMCYEYIHFQHSGADAARIYNGLQAFVENVAYELGVPILRISPSEIKQAATGMGNADKKEMLSSARRQFKGQFIEDDNQADALWALYFAMKEHGFAPQHVDELKLNFNLSRRRKSKRRSK